MKKSIKLIAVLSVSLSICSCGNNSNPPIEPVEEKLTVTWKNYDGTVLLTENEYKKGDTPSYSGDLPIHEKEEGYTFTWSGWSPAISAINENTTYTAVFTKTVNTYLVNWYDEDGITLLDTQIVNYGDTPIYQGSEPIKTSDVQYDYTFAGWDKSSAPITCETNYYAKYTKKIRSYKIRWENYDGTELKVDTLDYGIIPSYSGEKPTRPKTAEFSYEFKGWYPEVVSTRGDATYIAQFDIVKNQYNVTWLNGDDTILKTEKIDYGVLPIYSGTTPTKEGDDQYTYTFDSWTPTISEVTGDITYTPIFSKKINSYTITWKNGDNVLKTDTVEYGKLPVYDGDTPTKASTAQYSYTFTGWSPEVVEVSGDATYVAQFSSVTNKYLIKFVDEDGETVLYENSFEYGTKPTYPYDNPTKSATAQYTYTFAGWDKEIVSVTGEATYKATYSSTVNKYKIDFVDEDGITVLDTQEVAYGETPVYQGDTPTKEATAEFTYTFKGWDKEVVSVTGAATYTATYDSTKRSYTINFVDEDGVTVLDSQEVAYGETPVYQGDTPTKEATAEFTYTFKGWDKEVVSVTGAATYTATYDSTKRSYTINFVDEDGVTVLDSQEVAYGETPVYGGETPTKEPTAQYSYTFTGWDKEIVSVTGEATYKATYSSTVNKYLIKFVDEDGVTVLDSQEVEYGTTPVYGGETPTKEATAQYTYTFTGWDKEIVSVTKDATYKASFTPTVRSYTITWKNGDNVLKTDTVEYGKLPVYDGDTPTKASTAQYTYKFNGWSPEVVEVSGDATYVAQFSSTTNKYLIKFVDEDGKTVLYQNSFEYGTKPTYPYDNPTKAATAQYTYTFAGWDKEIVSVTKDATYKASFTPTVRSYTITWKNGDNVLKTDTVEYGKLPVYDGDTPTKASTAQYTYKFNGWSPEVTTVKGAATYKATYSSTINKYKITWTDDSGNILRVDNLNYGSTPEYGSTPSKPATSDYTFVFKGWTPTITAVSKDATYKAEFTAVLIPKITLNKTSLEIYQGETFTLVATVTPTTTTAISWSSNNSNASVNSSGVVTGLNAGNAIITAKCGNLSATCSVKVKGYVPSGTVKLIVPDICNVNDIQPDRQEHPNKDDNTCESLIIYDRGITTVIDGGDYRSDETRTKLVNQLKSLGVTKINNLILTHPHEDHTGALVKLIETFDIGTFYYKEVDFAARSQGSSAGRMVVEFAAIKEALNKKINTDKTTPVLIQPTYGQTFISFDANGNGQIDLGMKDSSLTFYYNKKVLDNPAVSGTDPYIIDANYFSMAISYKIGNKGFVYAGGDSAPAAYSVFGNSYDSDLVNDAEPHAIYQNPHHGAYGCYFDSAQILNVNPKYFVICGTEYTIKELYPSTFSTLRSIKGDADIYYQYYGAEFTYNLTTDEVVANASYKHDAGNPNFKTPTSFKKSDFENFYSPKTIDFTNEILHRGKDNATVDYSNGLMHVTGVVGTPTSLNLYSFKDVFSKQRTYRLTMLVKKGYMTTSKFQVLFQNCFGAGCMATQNFVISGYDNTYNSFTVTFTADEKLSYLCIYDYGNGGPTDLYIKSISLERLKNVSNATISDIGTSKTNPKGYTLDFTKVTANTSGDISVNYDGTHMHVTAQTTPSSLNILSYQNVWSAFSTYEFSMVVKKGAKHTNKFQVLFQDSSGKGTINPKSFTITSIDDKYDLYSVIFVPRYDLSYLCLYDYGTGDLTDIYIKSINVKMIGDGEFVIGDHNDGMYFYKPNNSSTTSQTVLVSNLSDTPKVQRALTNDYFGFGIGDKVELVKSSVLSENAKFAGLTSANVPDGYYLKIEVLFLDYQHADYCLINGSGVGKFENFVDPNENLTFRKWTYEINSTSSFDYMSFYKSGANDFTVYVISYKVTFVKK